MQLLLSDSGLCCETGDGRGKLSPHPASSSQGTNFANTHAKSFASIIQNSGPQQISGVKEGGGAKEPLVVAADPVIDCVCRDLV